jgi:sec-independent protein translocase protein TatB
MFSVPHLIILFLVVLVVFGPEKLPNLARTLGRVLGEVRRATGDLTQTLETQLHDLEREAEARRREKSTVSSNPNTIGPAPSELHSAEGTVPSKAPHGATLSQLTLQIPESPAQDSTSVNQEEKGKDGGTSPA